MPRIPTSLLRKAYALDPLLPRLLPPCRDLGAAQNELRWLREHVDNVADSRRAKGDGVSKRAFLRHLVKQRAAGKPLQYLLGTEYFGDLEICCRPGVLIPRQDTATSVQRLVRLVRDAQDLPSELRVLDLCTGTGCIPLLFHHDFYATRHDIHLSTLGIDISDTALQLAAHNLKSVREGEGWVHKSSIGYMKADVLATPFADIKPELLPVTTALRYARLPQLWDIVISNPPYISPKGYWKTTTRSVRLFEPKLALVPPPGEGNDDAEQGDAFYRPILKTAGELEAKVVLLEVADLDQALRVARAARDMGIFDGIEIWREQPDAPQHGPSTTQEFPVLGQGHARSVLCWRGPGTTWLGKRSLTSSPDPGALPQVPHTVDHVDRASVDISKDTRLHPSFKANLDEWKEHERTRREGIKQKPGGEAIEEIPGKEIRRDEKEPVDPRHT